DDLAGARTDAALAGRDDAFVLSFVAAAGTTLASSVTALHHPDLGALSLFLSPVDLADARRYEAVIDRTVPLASAFEDAPTPETAAAIAVATSSDPDAASKVASRASLPAVARLTAQRLRVTASAKRTGTHVTAGLHFPSTGIKAVEVRLVARGRTYATGTAVVRQHRAQVALKARHAVARGKYDLVITATKRDRTSQTVARTVTIR
ncbi:MAG: hypothetical protein REI11_19330, partial [Patulibacter sp.]|nr:hypothetical protein [Patulibacter sp.]